MAVEKLEKHEIFGLLSPTELSELSSYSGIMNLHEGDRVCTEGRPATHFFVLLKGRVELRKRTKEGPSFLVDDLLPGSVFGISSVADGARCSKKSSCIVVGSSP